MSDEDRWDNYESGPFCRHWSDPESCEQCNTGCKDCYHSGLVHDWADGSCSLCKCKEWKDPYTKEEINDKI